MGSESVDAQMDDLRRALAAAREGGHGAPDDLRRRVVDFVREQQGKGRSAKAVYDGLGVHQTTFSRWSRALPPRRTPKTDVTSKFRAVRVTLPAAPPAPVTTLRVSHPASGLVLEGVDVETLVTLLARLS